MRLISWFLDCHKINTHAHTFAMIFGFKRCSGFTDLACLSATNDGCIVACERLARGKAFVLKRLDARGGVLVKRRLGGKSPFDMIAASFRDRPCIVFSNA